MYVWARITALKGNMHRTITIFLTLLDSTFVESEKLVEVKLKFLKEVKSKSNRRLRFNLEISITHKLRVHTPHNNNDHPSLSVRLITF